MTLRNSPRPVGSRFRGNDAAARGTWGRLRADWIPAYAVRAVGAQGSRGREGRRFRAAPLSPAELMREMNAYCAALSAAGASSSSPFRPRRRCAPRSAKSPPRFAAGTRTTARSRTASDAPGTRPRAAYAMGGL